MNALVPIDSKTLETVSGGGSSSNIDSLINQLNGLKSSISDIKNKTSGFSGGEMLLLCMLALQNRPQNVVVVKRPGFWW
jgi:hypothetical protein